MPWSSLFRTSPSPAIRLRKKTNRNFFKSCPLSGIHSYALPVFPALLLFALLYTGMRQRELPACGGERKHWSPLGLIISDSSFSQGLCQACAGFLEPPDEGFPLPFPDLLWRLRNMWKDHVKAMLSGIVFTCIQHRSRHSSLSQEYPVISKVISDALTRVDRGCFCSQR